MSYLLQWLRHEKKMATEFSFIGKSSVLFCLSKHNVKILCMKLF